VQRFLKISKYLLECGWQPYVLTVKNGTYPSYDETLVDDIPEKVTVFKTKTIEPFDLLNRLIGKKGKGFSVGLIGFDHKKSLLKRLFVYIRANFFIPDARRGWKFFAVKEAKRIITKNDIDIIITTGPPHSTHLIGQKLHKKLKIPWVADFRDPWVNIYYNQIFPRSKHTVKKDQKLETNVLVNANLVTVVSKGLEKEFSDRTQKLLTIYNGFDKIDMPEEVFKQPTKKFTISYIGNFKPNQNEVTIWEAFSELMTEIEGFSRHLLISLTGNLDHSVLNSIRDYKLNNNLEINNFVTHAKATQLMAQASLLLFVIPKTQNKHLIITGKLFEYIASATPILSIGPLNGDAANVILQTNRDPIINYDDKENIKNTVKRYYDHWLKADKSGYKHPETDLTPFTRRHLTEKLSNELTKVIDEYRKS